jgi:hypothetical protein
MIGEGLESTFRTCLGADSKVLACLLRWGAYPNCKVPARAPQPKSFEEHTGKGGLWLSESKCEGSEGKSCTKSWNGQAKAFLWAPSTRAPRAHLAVDNS